MLQLHSCINLQNYRDPLFVICIFETGHCTVTFSIWAVVATFLQKTRLCCETVINSQHSKASACNFVSGLYHIKGVGDEPFSPCHQKHTISKGSEVGHDPKRVNGNQF